MKFVFLVFTSRSGSTMFARQLAVHSSNLVVLPEFNLLPILVSKGESSVKRMNSEQLLDLMRLDHQLSNLELTEEELRNIADRNQGKGIRQLVEDIVHRYAQKRGQEPEFVLIKRGSLVSLSEALMPLFPEAIYVHIYRDPRGVVNSCMQTDRPYAPGEKMGRGDVIYVIRAWVGMIRQIESLRQQNIPVLEVKYEDLLTSSETIVENILCQIGATYESGSKTEQSRRFGVGEREAAIHKLVDKAPVMSRMEAWKQELTNTQGVVLELIAQRVMRDRGYDLWFLKQVKKRAALVYFMYAYAVHFCVTMLYYGRKLLFHMKHRSLPTRAYLHASRLQEYVNRRWAGR